MAFYYPADITLGKRQGMTVDASGLPLQLDLARHWMYTPYSADHFPLGQSIMRLLHIGSNLMIS